MDVTIELKKILPERRIRTRYIDVVSFAPDAGFYHLVPKAVVQPINEAEIISLWQFSQQHQLPLVFRAGGSSLSGQAITDGILVDLSQYWDQISIEENGASVRVQPGITGAMVNAYLKKYQQKIGPDPASISTAMIGGILSNNSSGMCCGVAFNAYHTLKYIRFILPNGKTFDTEKSNDYSRFEQECPAIYQGLLALRDQIAADELLSEKIRHKYQIKNTMGYCLNAFIDYQHPLDILAHLLIGAEGTLAFIAAAVLKTVPVYAYKSTALLFFPNSYAACQAIIPLTEAGALMVELMDRASLHAVETMPAVPLIVKTLPEEAAALLVEFQNNNLETLQQNINQFLLSLDRFELLNDPVFTGDPIEQDFFWQVRKGLFPKVGGMRDTGTTVILEDIAFPVAKLGDGISDLKQLFIKYGYSNGIIFGHAKEGNIHFLITPDFNVPEEVARYDLFMREVVSLVVDKYNGSLKAEHGTGRNMAPFVETEWGSVAYEIMKKLKQLIDPNLLLNPGVIINADKLCHIRNLKQLPTVDIEVDKCIECGYCEHKCPSRDLTTTPRRRIIIRRALKKLQLAGDTAKYKLLLDQYQYDGIDTCATDGLCALACPVNINTGDLMKRLRSENHHQFSNRIALALAKNFKLLVSLLRAGIKVGMTINRVFGNNAMIYLTRGLKKFIPEIPLWSPQIAYPPDLAILESHVKKNDLALETTIVYFPACVSRMMGSYQGKNKNLMETFISICRKSAIDVKVLDNINSSCCGQMFSSKGFNAAAEFTANRIITQLWETSLEGKLLIVTDVSSCAYNLQQIRPILTAENREKFANLTILDSVDFLHDHVLPKIQVQQKKNTVVLHPVCALAKMGTVNKFINVAQHFANVVTVPNHAGCCAMAGDRGLQFPELTASATHLEAEEVKQTLYEGYYSSTKTCEMAMSAAINKNYESILYLADESSI